MTDIVEKIKSQLPDAVQAVAEFRGETTLTVKAEHLLPLCRFLRDDPDTLFNHLTFVTAVDYSAMGRQPRFDTVYEVYSLPLRHRLRLKVPLQGDSPSVQSVAELWPGADWHEREVYDLMGIRFKGHPDLRRIMLPDEWVGHPLRKDYPLGGEPVAFTTTVDTPALENLGTPTLEPVSIQPQRPSWARSDTMMLNMGPQHPSTHGVLRMVVELDGEIMVNAQPDIGHLHSGIEKTAEYKTYAQVLPYTDRMDYVSAMTNNLGYAMAVEKLLGVEIPLRAQYLRVIMCELQRISAHLVWVGTHCLDMAGMVNALLQYAYATREDIMNLFEMVSGARLTPSYIRISGVAKDVPDGFVPALKKFMASFPKWHRDIATMLDKNPIWLSRVKDIGVLTAEQAIGYGVTGPVLRATGVDYDVRKYAPYSCYDHFNFDVPTGNSGDCYDRYLVRMEEMRQSLRIIEQAIAKLPDGPVQCDDRKVVFPPREELDTSIEALIHHFKLVTEGFHPPAGEVYACVEAPKGEIGYYIVSDGGPMPYRLKIRGPSFSNLQSSIVMAKGQIFSDMVAIIGSVDITLGEVDR
jgi:NADH dehydrogenase I D subunit